MSENTPQREAIIGCPGSKLTKPTWVDFNNIRLLDAQELQKIAKKMEGHEIPLATVSDILDCTLNSNIIDDITLKVARSLRDTWNLLKK